MSAGSPRTLDAASHAASASRAVAAPMTELALILAVGVLGLAFAGYLARWVLACPPADEPPAPASPLGLSRQAPALPRDDAEMVRIAGLVRMAAEVFFAKQSSIIGAVSAVLGGAIFLAYGLLRRAGDSDPVPALELGVWLTISFAIGVSGSVLAGRVATWISLRTSLRAAFGVRRSTDRAVQIALRGGAVSGLFVTSASLLGLGGLFTMVLAYKGGFGRDPAAALRLAPKVPFMIAGYALGASFASLLAQIGGGAFAKAADLGADLVAKELGLGEDERENPAVIADLAGDVVGDGAGRAAGVFESTVAESLGAMILGAIVFRDDPRQESVLSLMLFPLVTRAFGVLAAMFGVMVVRTDDREDPRSALSRGLYVTAVLHAVGFAGAAKWLLGAEWVQFLACGAIGVIVGVGFLAMAQYYTEHRYRPVRELAEASRGGPTISVLLGIATGIEGAIVPLLAVVAAAAAAFHIGAGTGLAHGGLFGLAAATMGMLGPAAYLLAMDGFGPIVDNAAGIVEMTVGRERPDVRGRTVVLDAVGNTVKSLTKIWAAGAAALASLLLVVGFLDEIGHRAAGLGLVKASPHASIAASAPVLRLDRPEVFAAAIIGVLLVLWVAGRCLVSVARAARRVMDEARRQLKDRPSGYVPDHEACLEMVSRAALRHMIPPAVAAAAVPIAVGVALRFARAEDNPLVAADAVAALVMAGTMAGVLGSLLLGNAGGAWDNAKKYIATGAHGGRHLVDESGARVDNPTYGAALVGDTVGDPLKDLAGPAMHVLVKMLPVVTIVFLPFFV
ncbi:Pyrophosphate-energized proton pump [Minicystis rosea]|nr:Pyrophosphate-energized proton pump [Minicystis rosea]